MKLFRQTYTSGHQCSYPEGLSGEAMSMPKASKERSIFNGACVPDEEPRPTIPQELNIAEKERALICSGYNNYWTQIMKLCPEGDND